MHHRAGYQEQDQLIALCQQGDEAAWRSLVLDYGELLYRFCLGGLARDEDVAYDLAQETWCKAARYLNSFRGESEFKTWLFRIACNSWLNRVRTRQRKPEAVLVPDPATGDLPEPVDVLAPDRHAGARHDLEYVLSQLGPECQMVINLRFVLGYGEKEIAGLLEQNEKSVSSRISRCRAQAREIYNAG